LQSLYAALSADFATTAGGSAYETVLTINITTSAGTSIEIWAEVSASDAIQNNVTAPFRVTVDAAVPASAGHAIRLVASGQPNSTGFLVKVSGLVAGAHTILLQAQPATVIAQTQIRAGTQPTLEGASMLVHEIA
jgi:hypothetical protein